MKAFVINLLRRRGISVARRATLANFLRSRRVDLVLDVGANIGQFGRELRESGYRGEILSFEPIRAIHAELAKAAERDGKWTALHCAVGRGAGQVTINVSENTVFSSVMAQSELAHRFDPASRVIGTETIDLVTLDEVAAASTAESIFIKIDTQGFEQDVLAGASALLSRCVGLQLELPVEHLYAGVWSFHQALAFMDAAGFVPAQFHEVNPLHDDPASAIEFDCVFRRKH